MNKSMQMPFILALIVQNSFAGGLIGDIIRAVPGGKGLGDALDDGHRRWCNKMSSIPAAPDFLTV